MNRIATGIFPSSGVSGIVEIGTNIFDEIKAAIYLKNLEKIEAELKRNLEREYKLFLNKMGLVWGSPNARKFFEDFNSKHQRMMQGIDKTFDNIAENFNRVAQKDAQEKGSFWLAKNLQHIFMTPVPIVHFIPEKLKEGVGIKSQDVPNIIGGYSKGVRAAVEQAAREISRIAEDAGLVGIDKRRAFSGVGEIVKSGITNAFENMLQQFKVVVDKATKEEAIEDDVVSVINSIANNVADVFNGIFN